MADRSSCNFTEIREITEFDYVREREEVCPGIQITRSSRLVVVRRNDRGEVTAIVGDLLTKRADYPEKCPA